jgi:hypothetical protein
VASFHEDNSFLVRGLFNSATSAIILFSTERNKRNMISEFLRNLMKSLTAGIFAFVSVS